MSYLKTNKKKGKIRGYMRKELISKGNLRTQLRRGNHNLANERFRKRMERAIMGIYLITY